MTLTPWLRTGLPSPVRKAALLEGRLTQRRLQAVAQPGPAKRPSAWCEVIAVQPRVWSGTALCSAGHPRPATGLLKGGLARPASPALLAPRRPRGSQLRLATQRLPAQPPLPSWPSPCWLTLSDVTHCRRRSAVSDLGSGDSAALPGSLSTKMRCWSAGQRPAPPLCTTEADGCDSGTPAWEPRKAAVPASGLISLDLEPP